MTIVAALFITAGTLLEFLALELARRDLRDAHAEEEKREMSFPSMMAAGKHVTHAWISQATRTREWGVRLFMAGLVLQMIGNLASLI